MNDLYRRWIVFAGFVVLALSLGAGTASAQASRRAKKPKAVKPAYITSPPIRVKSYIRKGKVVRAHGRQRKPKTN